MKSFRPLLAFAALALVSACSSIPSARDEIASILEERTPQERVRLALDLLDRGEEENAKRELEAAIAAAPGDVTAQRLLEQINSDPRALLGERSRDYVVREGETMSVLAERFVGDPLMFYALSRYNNLDAPNALAPGQTLQVPDRRRATTASAPATATPASSARPETPPTVATRPAGDPARASQLRLAGLEQLNRGAVDRAVALLRQAQALDEGNASIGRDLDRALRLQSSLRGRS